MEKLNVQALALDVVAVSTQDSIRRGEFSMEPKLMASYTASCALYDMWAYKYIVPYLVDIDPSIRNDVGKVLYNTAILPITARIFGGKISLVNSLFTSAGSQFFYKGLNMLINRPKNPAPDE